MAVAIPPNLLLKRGLKLVGYSTKRQKNVSRHTSYARFRAHYGSDPEVYAQLFVDLQTTTIPDARVDEKDLCIDDLLMCLHFLKCYPTEIQQEAIFNVATKTARKWTRFYITKIHCLMPQKIVWPDVWEEKFIVSVDGTHCPIQEPRHPTLSKNPQFYSHKTNSAALNYEIGVAIFKSKIVWVNGPFPAGIPDISVYRMENGLRDKIPEGKRVLGDMGYKGETATVSIRNLYDEKDIKKFKRRARSRHETVNGRMKTFQSLKQVFHHDQSLHQKVFNAICVIVQYQLEIGSPLFDV